ncbi:MAG: NADH-quinone oxidoreductase subunit NuoG [Candidatus Eremiobacteraeota bacterium]|nr:NADH-quinone oxidoreductase subunit NuoG [Candidatus Eremiobacteraeota bacterium]
MSEVTLTIDGQSVSVPKGTLIVEAARKLNIEIPVYCYHPKLAPVGACRVCVVDVENQRRPIMPACATEVMEGMVVHTRNAAATRAREGVIELLLINHPLDCPVCDRGGECDLQDFTLRYGHGKSRFEETKRHFEKSKQVGNEVILDRERCIMCMRCVRFCDEVAMEEGLTIIERGTKAEIGPFPGRSFDSQFSGNTVEICPVGALTSRSYRFKSRPWELQNYASVCNGCATGCNLTVDVRYYEVARYRSRCNDAIDDGWLCDKGRYGYKFISSPDRLKKPLVRKNGQLVEASWSEALQAAAEGLKKFGADKVGAVAGPKLSNEGGWLLTRLMRGLLGSPNLDHRRGLAFREGSPLKLTAKIEGLDTATAIVVVGCDPTKTNPGIDLRIKKGLRRHAELICVGENGLSGYADYHVGSLAELSEAFDGLPEEEKAAITHPRPRPWEPGGSTSSDLTKAAKVLKKSNRVVFVFSEDHPVEGLEALAEKLGVEAPHGLLMLVAGANSVGLREMGVLPVFAPGWQKLAEAKEAYSAAWGSFATGEGADYASMTGSSNPLQAMLLIAEDRLEKKPDFLVVVDLFRSAAAEQADVVLPASSFVEQAMTMTNLDGTVQLCRQALPPQHESLPDWQILHKLAEALGQKWDTDTTSKIFSQIGRLNPLYTAASYNDFQTDAAVHWSYPQQGKIGTPRADLSGIPVKRADAAPWQPAVDTGSRVERVSRLLAGDQPPAVVGQLDPRQMASRLSLVLPVIQDSPPVLGGRIVAGTGPQAPGPSPANRYHAIGGGARELPLPAVQIKQTEAEQPVQEVTEA